MTKDVVGHTVHTRWMASMTRDKILCITNDVDIFVEFFSYSNESIFLALRRMLDATCTVRGEITCLPSERVLRGVR